MTEAARNVHGKSPDKRFAFARPLCQRGLKNTALPLFIARGSQQP